MPTNRQLDNSFPHCWKGAKFARFVGHPMTKMLSASGGKAPLTRGSAPDPRYRLVPPNHWPLLPPMILAPQALPLIFTSLRLWLRFGKLVIKPRHVMFCYAAEDARARTRVFYLATSGNETAGEQTHTHTQILRSGAAHYTAQLQHRRWQNSNENAIGPVTEWVACYTDWLSGRLISLSPHSAKGAAQFDKRSVQLTAILFLHTIWA